MREYFALMRRAVSKNGAKCMTWKEKLKLTPLIIPIWLLSWGLIILVGTPLLPGPMGRVVTILDEVRSPRGEYIAVIYEDRSRDGFLGATVTSSALVNIYRTEDYKQRKVRYSREKFICDIDGRGIWATWTAPSELTISYEMTDYLEKSWATYDERRNWRPRLDDIRIVYQLIEEQIPPRHQPLAEHIHRWR